MASRMNTMPLWAFATKIAAGAGQTSLLAAVAGKKIVVTFFKAHVIATAAQTADFTVGTVVIASLGLSEPLGDASYLSDLIRGIVGDSGQALLYTPSAAGYALHIVAEGYYE